MKLLKRIILICLAGLLGCFLAFLLLLFIKNHQSTEDVAQQIFGIHLENYDVVSVEDTLKWYSYGDGLEISLLLHSEEELEQLISELSVLGFALDKTEIAENGVFFRFQKWARQLWCVTDRGKGTHGGHVSIVPNEEGYYVHLIYGEC